MHLDIIRYIRIIFEHMQNIHGHIRTMIGHIETIFGHACTLFRPYLDMFGHSWQAAGGREGGQVAKT